MVNLSGKKLLILGGIALLKEIVTHAKNLGLCVYVTDYLPDSPAKKEADKSFMVSTTDVDGLSYLVKAEKVDGILTGFVDMLLPYYQQVCEKTDRPCYGTRKQFNVFTNKYEFKNLCRKFNIPVVEEYEINHPLSLIELSKLNYPVILKPADNSGGRGIVICNNPSDLIDNFEKVLSFSPTSKILVEPHVNAKEVTIFYFVQDGRIYLTAMGDRHVKHFNNKIIPLPVAYSFPSIHLENFQSSLHQKVVNMLRSIGIKNGMIFIQSFVLKNECVFYEIGYRLTGSLEYKIINHASDFNPMDLMIQHAVTGSTDGIDIEELVNPRFSFFYCNITFLIKPGTIGIIRGKEEILAMENVLDVFISYSVGDVINDNVIGTLAQVIARVFAYSDTIMGLADIMNRIQSIFKVESTEGENLLLSPFNTGELFDS
ncbi:MAG: hypothetical protein JXB17_09745 [Bacteroidales bacterium]|nr:hypothetical protein [Bacteroidales bacterium]